MIYETRGTLPGAPPFFLQWDDISIVWETHQKNGLQLFRIAEAKNSDLKLQEILNVSETKIQSCICWEVLYITETKIQSYHEQKY